MNELSSLIFGRIRVLFANIETMLRTFDPEAELFDMPLWKHAYHLLHSADRWFINPACFEEPPFHTPGLNSLSMPSPCSRRANGPGSSDWTGRRSTENFGNDRNEDASLARYSLTACGR
jgi:hypothetical protein